MTHEQPGRSARSGLEGDPPVAARVEPSPACALGGELFSALVAFSPTPTAIVEGPEHRFSFVNAAYRALARGKGELVGRAVAEVWPELPEAREILDRALASGEPHQTLAARPFRVRRDRGPETVWLTFSVLPVLGPAGAVDRIVVMASDLTEHARALQTARDLAAELAAERQQLLRATELATALSTADTRPEVARAILEDGPQVFGAVASVLALVPPRARADVGELEIVDGPRSPARRLRPDPRAPLADALRLGEAVWLPSRDVALSRYPGWDRAPLPPGLAWAVLPLAASGRVLGALGLAFAAERPFDPGERDLALAVAQRCAQALERAGALEEQARLQEALRDNEARYRNLVDISPDAVLLSRHGRVALANPACARLFGAPAPSDLLGRSTLSLFHPECHAEIRDRAALVRAGGSVPVVAQRILRLDGAVRDVEVAAAGFPEPEGVAVQVVLRDVTERKALQDRNARLFAELRESDRRKTEFLSVLSHELRNPLSAIRNGLHVLDLAPPGGDPARRARAVLHRQSEHLTRLVDDLLDLTRITHGKIALSPVRLDAREIAHRAEQDVRGAFEQREVELRLAEPAGPVWVDADPARLAQMLGNLLSNALKFTPSGGRVSLAVTSRGAACEVAVADTGCGIDPADLERIFEPFVQARAGSAAHGGLGIGLALVRTLSALHGGSVRAASAGPGRGAEFVLSLPLAGAPAGAGAGPTPAPGPRVRPLSVLIVEDNEDAGATLAALLQLDGHEVRVAPTGRAGLEAAAARSPDVLVCDLGLPDVVGHEVVRALRAAPHGGALFAVALTGYAQPEDRARALAAGFDEHLSKPPSLPRLRELLAEAARRPSPAPPPPPRGGAV